SPRASDGAMRPQRPRRSPRRSLCAVVALSAFVCAGATTSAAEGRAGAPPKVLNVVRQTLKRGTSAAYAALRATIDRGYERAKIRMYWIALQASKSATEILYLNLFDAPDGLERATAIYRETMPRHADLVRLQQRLAAYGASAPISTLTTRRDEFVYGRRDVD